MERWTRAHEGNSIFTYTSSLLSDQECQLKMAYECIYADSVLMQNTQRIKNKRVFRVFALFKAISKELFTSFCFMLYSALM